jgi:prepilin-type N-terminal cleavage/methylation domain-containing protein/prepilin-type processing-associated H-X9-DG protein
VRDYSSDSPRRAAALGFTLVELLIVITIIGVLMSLLIPAVNMAREAARRAECLNNIRQIGQGAIMYEQSKGYFMGRNFAYPRASATPINSAWTIAMLPYVGRNDVYDQWPTMWTEILTAGPSGSQAPYIELFVCPSDAEATTMQTSLPISFAVNAGRPDFVSGSNPIDFQENGIFHHNYYEQTNSRKPTRVSLSFLSKHDGTSNTILLAEKLSADMAQNNTFASWVLPGGGGVDGTELTDAIVWMRTQAVPEFPISQWLEMLASNAVAIQESSPSANVKVKMRPSSNHPGGFNTVFADGSAKFISDQVSYRVYTLLMTPYGKKTKEPGTGVPTANGPGAPAPWVGGILNEADLN